MVQLPWQEKHCYKLTVSLQLVAAYLCNCGLYKSVYRRHGKLTIAYTLKSSRIYKTTAHLFILHLEGIQIF